LTNSANHYATPPTRQADSRLTRLVTPNLELALTPLRLAAIRRDRLASQAGSRVHGVVRASEELISSRPLVTRTHAPRTSVAVFRSRRRVYDSIHCNRIHELNPTELPPVRELQCERPLRNTYAEKCEHARINCRLLHRPVAEWLACWTQAQKGPGSNRSRDAVG